MCYISLFSDLTGGSTYLKELEGYVDQEFDLDTPYTVVFGNATDANVHVDGPSVAAIHAKLEPVGSDCSTYKNRF